MVSIYLLENCKTGLRYVGRTKNKLSKRLKAHWDVSRYKPQATFPLVLSLRNSDPSDWQMTELCKVDPELGATFEDLFISLYQTTNPAHGLNCLSARQLVLRESTRAKMRVNNSERNPRMKPVNNDDVCLLYSLGFGTKLIGRMVGLDATAIQARLVKQGITLRKPERVNGRFQLQAIPILQQFQRSAA